MVNIFDFVDVGLKFIDDCVIDWIVVNVVVFFECDIILLVWFSDINEYRGNNGCDFAGEL